MFMLTQLIFRPRSILAFDILEGEQGDVSLSLLAVRNSY